MTKRTQLKVGDFTVSWLRGGTFGLDGGAMFGPVPKVLWSQKWQADDNNMIFLKNSTMLVRTGNNNVLIDTGLGNKLTPKQHKIFNLTEPWLLFEDLESHGLTNEDIDTVILTHCDFDHAGGAVMLDPSGNETVTFPKAQYVIQKDEWYDVQNTNNRSASTYWPINFSALQQDQLELIDGDKEICPGVKVLQTGGHTKGHQIVELQSKDASAVHLGDLFPTTHHLNPLWVMAYDNFPLEVIEAKERLMPLYAKQKSWFLLYHDLDCLACKLSDDLKIIDTL